MIMKRQIIVYPTHIEVYPYEWGNVRRIEDQYSVWDPIYYKSIPVAYTVINNTLYLPRGASVAELERIFDTPAYIDNDIDPDDKIEINTDITPKSKIQGDAIDFLCKTDNHQLSLNLEPGEGKTIATITAICNKFKTKTIIILHESKLKNQWRREFHHASDISDDEIVDIKGSDQMQKVMDGEVNGSIYLVNHQTIHSFAKINGWYKVKEFFSKIHCGLKVFDEAHKYFNNILMIDFFSNTKTTIYLTATFTRTHKKEKFIFRRAFSECSRFGENEDNGRRHHIEYYYVTYDSHPDPCVMYGMYNKFSISPFKYIEYALNEENNTMLKVLKMVLKQVERLKGKIFITSPKINSSEVIAEYISKLYPDKKVVAINSTNDAESNEAALNSDIISSTMKSVGTGLDVKGMRVFINLEPFTAESNMIQLKGRLREYSETEDTYFFDIVDIGFDDIKRMGETRRKTMKRFAKIIKDVRL